MNVRTRFAPSPTGFLHIGGARTALFSWAYARRHGGKFILRIEDTDFERSTAESVNAILESMRWLGLDWDEGPHFQMKRLVRYREVADKLIAGGHAYPCWATKEELEELRTRQRQTNEKPRYDGRWRPDRAQGLKKPEGVKPVIRFRTPEEGEVGWQDLVKGPISFPNRELDDLVLLRADGVPTYNFGVVVDDLDMEITHVIRGDDHVNNTPRQIHIFNAMGKSLPAFAHLPMILGADGERLSKRHGAVSVMQYRDEGFLPEALLNYLARLGWSHGDEEVFSVKQLVEWFDLGHVSRSPARFDVEKLRWLNGLYKQQGKSQIPPEDRLGKAQKDEPKLENLEKLGYPVRKAVDLFWSAGDTVSATSSAVLNFYAAPAVPADLVKQYVTTESLPALRDLHSRISKASAWEKEGIKGVVNSVLKDHQLKMPQLAMPLRVILWGTTKTKAIDESLEALGRKAVLERLAPYIKGD